MNALLRVLKNEKYFTLLLLVLFVFNSAVFLRTEAKAYKPSAGASNLYIKVDKENSPQGVTKNAGIIGNALNQFNDDSPFSSISYSTRVSDCKDNNLNCKSLADLEALDALNPPGFNGIDAIASLNGTLIDQRPISAVDYFQDKIYALTHFNSVSAQAAVTPDGEVDSREAYYSPGGTGFSLLKPIQNFWSWSVRVVYGFLLIIVIIIAFAIMFRQRLSGSVEVTVQNAIPAIALAMILVPLSYAISGLFIDFITVGTNAVHEFLIGAPGSPGNTLYINSGADDNLYKGPLGQDAPTADRGYYPDDIRVDWLRARDQINVSSTFGAIGQDVGEVSGLNGNVIFLAIGSIVNTITGQSSDDPADFTWVGDIVQFFISIVTLWIGLKIFVALFKKYMTIILYPVISPFIFATVAIPGNGTKSIMQYVKVMLAAALAYIVTYAMFLLSIIFTSQDFLNDVPTFASASFNPPLIGLRSIGIGSNEMTQLLLTLIGLGIYFSIPSTLKSIDDSLGANNPLPKFLTTPIDSFNESRKVMFKQLPAGVLAGGASVVSGIRGGAKGLSNIRTGISDASKMPAKARGRARQMSMSYQNWRKGGLKAGERGSAELAQADVLSTKIRDKEAERREAINQGRGGDARRLAGEITGLREQAENLGVQNFLSSNIKDEDKMKLNAVFKGNGSSDNEIVFKTPDIDALVAKGPGLKIAGGGKLVLEATGSGNVLPANIVVEVYEAIQNTSTGKFDKGMRYSTMDKAFAAGLVFPPSVNPKSLGDVFDASKSTIDTLAQLVCAAKEAAFVSQDGRKIEIPFDLQLDVLGNIGGKRLFGTKVGTATTYTGGWIDTISAAKTGVRTLSSGFTDRFIIKIGDLESDAIKVSIKYVS